MKKHNDLRLIVAEAIKSTGMTVYGIAKLIDQPKRNQIYNFLNGKTDLPGDKITKILDACQVKVKIEG